MEVKISDNQIMWTEDQLKYLNALNPKEKKKEEEAKQDTTMIGKPLDSSKIPPIPSKNSVPQEKLKPESKREQPFQEKVPAAQAALDPNYMQNITDRFKGLKGRNV